jgi:hypothetical protein
LLHTIITPSGPLASSKNKLNLTGFLTQTQYASGLVWFAKMNKLNGSIRVQKKNEIKRLSHQDSFRWNSYLSTQNIGMVGRRPKVDPKIKCKVHVIWCLLKLRAGSASLPVASWVNT